MARRLMTAGKMGREMTREINTWAVDLDTEAGMLVVVAVACW